MNRMPSPARYFGSFSFTPNFRLFPFFVQIEMQYTRVRDGIFAACVITLSRWIYTRRRCWSGLWTGIKKKKGKKRKEMAAWDARLFDAGLDVRWISSARFETRRRRRCWHAELGVFLFGMRKKGRDTIATE